MLLHIANDFSGSKIYRNLVEALDAEGICQSVYTAVRDKSLVGRNKPTSRALEVSVQYNPILSTYTRINFYAKQKRIYKNLRATVCLDNVKLIHAHTWYSDGVIAFRLYKELGIPYVISIRDTDINLFYSKMLHLRALGREILLHAKKIVFISAAYQKRLLESFAKTPLPLERLKSSSEVIPNGIDAYWLENILAQSQQKKSGTNTLKLIYVGNFSRRKNVLKLIKALTTLNRLEDKPLYHLTLVGGGGRETKRIMKALKHYPKQLEYLGRIKEKKQLRDVYRACHAFVMPSLTETFGLVYVEAMSQGLPVLYSQGEGIDGYFDDRFGVNCNPHSLKSIMNGLTTIRERFTQMQPDPDFLRRKFDWKLIAKKYIQDIYGEELFRVTSVEQK